MDSLHRSQYSETETLISLPSGENVTFKYPTCIFDILDKIDTEKDNKLVGVNVDGELKNLKYVLPFHRASVEPGMFNLLSLAF